MPLSWIISKRMEHCVVRRVRMYHSIYSLAILSVVVQWKVPYFFACYLCRPRPSEELCLLQLKWTKKLFMFVAVTLCDYDGNWFRTGLRTASPIVLLMVISVKNVLSLTALFLTRASSNYYSNYAVIDHFTWQTTTSLRQVGCCTVTRSITLYYSLVILVASLRECLCSNCEDT